MSIQWTEGPKKGQEEYVGAVLDCPTYLPQAGSPDWEPVYAYVWDEAKQAPVHVNVGWVSYANGGRSAHVTLDATEYVRALLDNYLWDKAVAEQARRNMQFRLDQLIYITQGRLVRVVRGRKIKPGTEGIVAWSGQSRFGLSTRLQVGTTSVFVATKNLAVVLVPAEFAEFTRLVKDLCGDGILARDWADKAVVAGDSN